MQDVSYWFDNKTTPKTKDEICKSLALGSEGVSRLPTISSQEKEARQSIVPTLRAVCQTLNLGNPGTFKEQLSVQPQIREILIQACSEDPLWEAILPKAEAGDKANQMPRQMSYNEFESTVLWCWALQKISLLEEIRTGSGSSEIYQYTPSIRQFLDAINEINRIPKN